MFIAELFDHKREHREGLDLEVRTNDDNMSIYAYATGKELAYVHFDKNNKNLVPYDLAVGEDYRGQGIAGVMYDYAKELGYTIQRSSEQTDAGKYFWDKNRGEEGQVWEAEEKTLDPEIYGEDLPIATVRRIVTAVIAQVDPTTQVKVRQSPEGYYLAATDNGKLQFDFGITAQGGEISANLVNAYSSYKGNGIVTKIIDLCFKAMVKKYGRPEKFVMSAHEDRGHGVWQHIAQKLGAEWEGSLSEVTTVPTVAKKKTQHLDVMPNDGRPIPAGKEADYLGQRVGKLGNVEVWTYSQGPMRTYLVFDPATRISQLAVTGSSYPNNADSLIIKGVYSGPKNSTRAANLYAWLIKNQGLTLVSDIKQSTGGQRVWQELERRYGRYINIHGFDTKTNEPVNVSTQDEPDTHVDQAHLSGATQDIKHQARNIRLVASPK